MFLGRLRQIILLSLIISLLLGTGLIEASPPVQTNASPINYGDTVQGVISAEVPSLIYTFSGREGDDISITATNQDAGLDPFLALSDQTGNSIMEDDDGAGNNNAQILMTLPVTGAFFITVTSSPIAEEGARLGVFSLALECDNCIITTTDIENANNTPDPVPTNTIQTETRLQRIVPNSTIVGSFNQTTNFNLYWFEGSAEQSISFQNTFTSDIDPLLVLYDNDLREIQRNQAGQNLEIVLNADGLYFLAIASLEIGTAGGYQVNFIQHSQSSEAELNDDTLIYGQTRTGVISNTNPTRRFRFSAEAGDTITITMNRTDGDLDSLLVLASAAGVTLAEDNDGGGINGDARIADFLISETGDYFIFATRRQQDLGFTAGGFELSLTSDAPPRLPTDSQMPSDYVGLPQISYGGVIDGTISNDQFVNIFVFYGDGGDNISISMESTDGQLDPKLILLDANRIPLTENDDVVEGQVRDSLLEYVLPDDGYYAIVATRFEDEEGSIPVTTGDYTLTFDLSDNVGTSSSPVDLDFIDQLSTEVLIAGQTPNGSYRSLTLGKIYNFEAAEGSLIDFSVTADANAVSTVILFNSNFQTLAASDNSVLLAITAPATDDYYVLVTPQVGPAITTDSGYFVALNIEVGNGSGGTVFDGSGNTGGPTVPITYGNTAEGTLSDITLARRYTFQGQEGDFVEIFMNATGTPVIDPLLQLYGPDGELVGENDDVEPGVNRNSAIRMNLPETGQYTIVATRYTGEDAALSTSGDFTLSLQWQNPATVGVNQEVIDIEYGQSLNGTIDEDTYLQFYYFVGVQGDNIIVDINTLDGNLDGVLYLYALTSNNEPLLLVANDDSPLGGTYDPYIEYTLPRSGPYLIAITRYNDPETDATSGTYNISLDVVEASEDTPAESEATTE